MQLNTPILSGSPSGHSRIMKMLLHLSLEGGRQSQAWPDRNAISFDRAQDVWATEWDQSEWPPRLRLAVLLSAALGSWAVVLGATYLLWQAF